MLNLSKWWKIQVAKSKLVTAIPHSKLELCFTDSEGTKYYKFPEAMSLPVERFGKLQEFMMWMSSSLTSTELDLLLDSADKALANGVANGKNAAKIGFIISQIRDRKNMVIHTELLYNFLAVQVIREDEATEYFNNEIHLQKIIQFKEETKNGKTYDFFLRIGLKKLNALFNMSEEEWNKAWKESEQLQAVLEPVLKKILKEESVSSASPSMSK